MELCPMAERLMGKLCVAGASSVGRYCEISGLSPREMPELFMQAYVADRLGDEVTSTLETNWTQLIYWNENARAANKLPLTENFVEAVKELALDLGRQRVDLVFYEGQDRKVPKNEQSMFALVEFKCGFIDGGVDEIGRSDRQKLLRLLKHIDTCRYGVVCGWIESSAAEECARRAAAAGDHWFKADVVFSSVPRDYVFGARVFINPDFKGHLSSPS